VCFARVKIKGADFATLPKINAGGDILIDILIGSCYSRTYTADLLLSIALTICAIANHLPVNIDQPKFCAGIEVSPNTVPQNPFLW
jgi:hypothetical protein